MFYISTAFRNIRRYKYKSLLAIFIGIVAVMFLNTYTGNLKRSREQLYSLEDKMLVEASVSNLTGGQESGIFIREERYENVLKSGRIKEPRFTVQLTGSREGQDYSILAANTRKAVPGLKKDSISFIQGDEDAFFSSDKKECLAAEKFLKENQLKPGDEITLDVQYFELKEHTDIFARPLETATYKIIGSVKEKGEEDTENMLTTDIILPIETIRESYHKCGIEFFADSGRFYVKNPLKLNEFKEEMKKIGFMELSPKADYALDGNALVVRDEAFIRASGSLREGYQVMEKFLPVIALILAGAGFISAYLLINGRRQEFATMRSLGMPKRGCMLVYLIEYGTTEFAGGVIGTALSCSFAGLEAGWLAVDFMAFYLCFLAGTAAAAATLGKVSVMEVLAKAD